MHWAPYPSQLCIIAFFDTCHALLIYSSLLKLAPSPPSSHSSIVLSDCNRSSRTYWDRLCDRWFWVEGVACYMSVAVSRNANCGRYRWTNCLQQYSIPAIVNALLLWWFSICRVIEVLNTDIFPYVKQIYSDIHFVLELVIVEQTQNPTFASVTIIRQR